MRAPIAASEEFAIGRATPAKNATEKASLLDMAAFPFLESRGSKCKLLGAFSASALPIIWPAETSLRQRNQFF